jgi:hypothetical protein
MSSNQPTDYESCQALSMECDLTMFQPHRSLHPSTTDTAVAEKYSCWLSAWLSITKVRLV